MNRSSIDRQMRDMEEALRMASGAAPDSLPGYLKAELEHHLAGIVAVRLRQHRTRYEAERATRLKNQSLAAGRQAAARLRCCIRAVLGPRNPRLEEFGIAPSRPRRRAPLIQPPE